MASELLTISESKLKTWAEDVQLRKNVETCGKVKQIFSNSDCLEIYLQGSVANCTNIRVEGDLDVICQLNPPYSNGGDIHTRLRNHIKSVLNRSGIRYREGNKSIKLFTKSDKYQNVDLVPCVQYVKRYQSHSGSVGIKIKTPDGRTIINYPKLHKQNGDAKNKQTKNYKKMVRIFKNIKSRLTDGDNLAPSYFVECLIYNISGSEFYNHNPSLGTVLCKCLNWLNSNMKHLPKFRCQNGVTYLFGNDSAAWNVNDCKGFIKKATQYATRPR